MLSGSIPFRVDTFGRHSKQTTHVHARRGVAVFDVWKHVRMCGVEVQRVSTSVIRQTTHAPCLLLRRLLAGLRTQTIITFYNCTQKAIADSPPEAKITWAHIKTTMSPLLQKVSVAGVVRLIDVRFSSATLTLP